MLLKSLLRARNCRVIGTVALADSPLRIGPVIAEEIDSVSRQHRMMGLRVAVLYPQDRTPCSWNALC